MAFPPCCDGITQGEAGMEMSLFSRDVIALSTAVALSHQMFDAALYLGVCDKIVPGLIIGRAFIRPSCRRFSFPRSHDLGHAQPREIADPPALAERKCGRDRLLEAEANSYHAPGTCTFYGTANSNQMLMEIMACTCRERPSSIPTPR